MTSEHFGPGPDGRRGYSGGPGQPSGPGPYGSAQPPQYPPLGLPGGPPSQGQQYPHGQPGPQYPQGPYGPPGSGYPQPGPGGWPGQAPPPRQRSGLLVPLLVGAAVLVVLAGAMLFFVLGQGDDGPLRGPSASRTVSTCTTSSTIATPEASPDDKTISFTTGAGSEELDEDTLRCLLRETSAPDSVYRRMQQTRSIDGMQHASWDGWEAYWNYHPRDGLDLTISRT